MAEHIKSPRPQSHASSLREDAVRRLSRSPHPYHKQNSELPYASEQLILTEIQDGTTLVADTSVDGRRGSPISGSERYRESTNSDSGTEADDEHFLKGLPAPRLRPPKGLRGADGSISGASTPILSQAIGEEVLYGRLGYAIKRALSPEGLNEKEVRKAVETFRHHRRIEIVRRATECGILAFIGIVLYLNPEIRRVISIFRTELLSQGIIIASLTAAYPIRLLCHIDPQLPWRRPSPLVIPSSFDPAPLLYPPTITTFVSLILFTNNPAGFLPSIILSISSLPKALVPAPGGLDGSRTLHWAFASVPLWLADSTEKIQLFNLDREALVLIPPLHEALCTTLNYLTTTSLLPAELQLLSIALIYLLLLASSPQAVILKAVLWIVGIGLLVTCEPVLRWGVALARVPRWRFRRPGIRPVGEKASKLSLFALIFGRHATAAFAAGSAATDSSDEEYVLQRTKTQAVPAHAGPAHSHRKPNSGRENAPRTAPNRRHTVPAGSTSSASRAGRSSSDRKKRSSSSSVQAFFHLTQSQATVRKWIYAFEVYVCVACIILVGVRLYVQEFALHGDEPLGWALAYFFGDIPRFRFEVVSANLQRWIPLPRRRRPEDLDAMCRLGWMPRLREQVFGEANTRLILSAYWLGIIVVGLAVVFRLSSVCEVDTRRKVFHFMMVAMLLPATYIDPTFAALSLSLILAIFLLLDLFRASQLPPLSRSLAYFLAPYVDGRDLKGPVVISHIFLLIGCAVPLWLSLGTLPRSGAGSLAGWDVPRSEVSMVAGVICVGMGDAAASLVGRRYGRRKWLWRGGKSIEGSVAFALAVYVAMGVAKAWLRIGGWSANNDDPWTATAWKAGVAASVASLTEAVLTGGNDNVVVPIVLWLCVKGLDI